MDEINAYIAAAQILISAGVATVAQVRSMFAHHGLSEEQLNAVAAQLEADAERRAALARADAGK